MRKKLMVIGMVLALIMGCATIYSIQKILCSPTPEQQATAASIKRFIASGAVILAPIIIETTTGAKVNVTYDQAISALSAVENGLCVGATDLRLALEWFTAATAPIMVKGLKKAPVRAVPDTGPLWQMLDRK